MDVYVVDAFTEHPFGGNPAGVVLLTEPREPEWMQHVAEELKHAETAFAELVGGERAGDPMPLRWFTPTNEVDLCGHATLACAHVLGGDVRFATRSGVLGCTTVGDGWVHMDFPADPPTGCAAPPSLSEIIGQIPVSAVAEGVSDLLVELGSEQAVRELRPDIATLATLPHRGVIFTAAAQTAGLDFVSRCFYPSQGINEDSVTGSAHCTLACWWADRLGTTDLLGEQASARGGRVRVSRRDDRVALSGHAVTVLSGRLHA